MSGTNPLPAGQWCNIPPLAAGNLAPSNNGDQPGMAGTPLRPLRGAPASFVRQPYLGQTPAVQNVTGLGSGGGASVTNQGSDADQSQGLVALRVGLNPTSGNVNLTLLFPFTPAAGQYQVFADWAQGGISVNIIGNALVLGCATGGRQLIPGELLLLAYQWSVSG